jgi:Ca2+-binding RTX toxin-like protein
MLGVGYVTLLALADGSYMLTWVETVGDIEGFPINALVAQPIDMNGEAVGDPVLLAAYGQEPDFGPTVSFAANPSGGFVAMWPMIDFSTGAITYNFFGQLFDVCGCPIGSPFRPTETGEGGDIAILADGTIVTTWTDFDSDDRGVFLKLYRPADEPFVNDGNDILIGDETPNSLDGGDGDDQLYGLGGDDNLLGGQGGDLLDGGTGADTMAGGPGNDIYFVDEAGDVVTENPGEGTDEIRTGLATFSLAGLPNVENLTGTSETGQSLTGNAAANIVNAGPGNDFISLQAGGSDYALGNQGNDVFLFGGTLTALDQVDGGDGIDQIALQGNYVGGTALTLGGNVGGIENLAILPGNDTRFGDPGTNFYDYNITITDSVLGEGVQLVIDANRLRPGEDLTVDGSTETDGSFFIYGGGGTDILTGGDNNDVFIFGGQNQWGASDVVTGGAGTDQLALRGNYTIVFGAGQLVGIEQIGMVSAQDTRYGALGSSYSYDLTMVDANVDAIQFTVDAAPLRPGETLTFNGSAEDDGSFRVFGGRGNDTITGSQNGDIIAGNAGADVLTGGGGGDEFRYVATLDSAPGAADHILDFTPGTDWIDLSRIDADTHAAGNQAFHWIGSDGFHGTGPSSAGELRAYQAGNSWFVEGDTDGNGSADFVIEFTVVAQAPLEASNFLL